jgi:hypothetical protein
MALQAPAENIQCIDIKRIKLISFTKVTAGLTCCFKTSHDCFGQPDVIAIMLRVSWQKNGKTAKLPA